MSDTPRHTTRRPPVSSPRAPLPPPAAPGASPQRLEALRRLIAAGQYEVNPRFLAAKIFRAAGVPMPE